VELLIDKGSDVNFEDKTGRTPIYLAVQYGRIETAELLLSKDADVNVKDNNGVTPLKLAQDKSGSEMVELLKKYGATE